MEIKIEDKTDHTDFELAAETGESYLLLNKRFSGPLESVYIVSDVPPKRFGGGRQVYAKIMSSWNESYEPMSTKQCAESINKLLDRLSEDESFAQFKLYVDNQYYRLRYLELLDDNDNKVASMHFSSDGFSVTFAAIKDTDSMDIAKKLNTHAHLCAAIIRHALIEFADAMPELRESLDAEDMTFTLQLDAEAGRRRAERMDVIKANFDSQLTSLVQTNPETAYPSPGTRSITEEPNGRSMAPNLIGRAEDITFAWDSKMAAALIAAFDEKRPPEFYRKIAAGNIEWGLRMLKEGNIAEAIQHLDEKGLSKVGESPNAIDNMLETSLRELLAPLRRGRAVSESTMQKVDNVLTQVMRHRAAKAKLAV